MNYYRDKKGRFIKGHPDFVSSEKRKLMAITISKSKKGYKMSKVHKLNMIKAITGRKLSDKHKENISNSLKGRFLKEESSQWKGGISKKPYNFDFIQELRDKIIKRDSFVCQLCGNTQDEEIEEFGYKLNVHHIDYDKTNSKENNLITLCRRCNSIVNKDRLGWMKYFKKRLNWVKTAREKLKKEFNVR